MQLISNELLNEVLLQVIDRCSYSSLDNQYFTYLYNTGSRALEPLTPSTYVDRTMSNILVRPFKGNNIRTIPITSIPPSIYNELNDNKSYLTKSSYITLLRRFDKYMRFPKIFADNKPMHLHLFRFNYVRQLELNGIDIPTITNIMGWTSTTMANQYLNKELYIK